MKDVVVFDEVSKVRFPNPDEVMGKLKDFMESGQYERGDKKATSDASLVFMGNVEVERDKTVEESYLPVDLTYVLPEPMRGSAFIDRVHGLLPGWELPKIPVKDTPGQGVWHSLRLLLGGHTHDEEGIPHGRGQQVLSSQTSSKLGEKAVKRRVGS